MKELNSTIQAKDILLLGLDNNKSLFLDMKLMRDLQEGSSQALLKMKLLATLFIVILGMLLRMLEELPEILMEN